VDGNSGDVVPNEFNLAGVQTSADFESQRLECAADGESAADGAGGCVEGCQHPVAGGLHRSAPEPVEFSRSEYAQGLTAPPLGSRRTLSRRSRQSGADRGGGAMYTTIVVGAHKSQTARRAVVEATELARALGAHVHLVSAYPKDNGPIDGKDSPGRAEAQRSMDALVLSAASQKFTTHALPGDPAKAILTVAKDVGADLIVVGNKGMKGKGRFLGSVPNDIAHQAPCAVLIVYST